MKLKSKYSLGMQQQLQEGIGAKISAVNLTKVT